MKKRDLTKVICPCCGGDGKETCHNPDHGFFGLINSLGYGANESACPCCGHDPNHKVKNGGDCELCEGAGVVSEQSALEFMNEMNYDFEIQKIDQILKSRGM